jgi:protein-S-isoprenylcysteine O-methyltransferase Ste14
LYRDRAAVLRRSLLKYALAALLMMTILLLASGRPEWRRAWIYVAVTLGAQIGVGAILYRRNPDLLEERSRLQSGTKGWDKILAPAVALVGPLAIWFASALDVRAHWPPTVPTWWSAAAFVVCLLGITITAWAMVSNRFFSATVRIQSERGHEVVDRGPYRYVRHPGYAGAVGFTLASPVALGSWLALVPAALTVAVLVVRTGLEDAVLQKELQGYSSYARRVRNRLLPGIW